MQGGESRIEGVSESPACCSQVRIAMADIKYSFLWCCSLVEHLSTFLFCLCDRITALPTGVLQIYGVEQKDAGNYRCVATTITSRRKSAEATLNVIPGTQHVRFFHSIIAFLIIQEKHLNALRSCNYLWTTHQNNSFTCSDPVAKILFSVQLLKKKFSVNLISGIIF